MMPADDRHCTRTQRLTMTIPTTSSVIATASPAALYARDIVGLRRSFNHRTDTHGTSADCDLL